MCDCTLNQFWSYFDIPLRLLFFWQFKDFGIKYCLLFVCGDRSCWLWKLWKITISIKSYIFVKVICAFAHFDSIQFISIRCVIFLNFSWKFYHLYMKHLLFSLNLFHRYWITRYLRDYICDYAPPYLSWDLTPKSGSNLDLRYDWVCDNGWRMLDWHSLFSWDSFHLSFYWWNII